MASSKKYEVVITDSAFNDLDRIYEYIKNNIQMPDTAEKQVSRIEKATLRLGSYPHSCSIVLDDMLAQKGYRKLVIDNYIAFYLTDDKNKKVIVMRVLYGAQRYENII